MDQQPGKLSFATDWQYSAAPESTDHIRIAEQYGLFIGGEFVAGTGYFSTLNPATEERLSEVPAADDEMVDRAVRAAREAFDKRFDEVRLSKLQRDFPIMLPEEQRPEFQDPAWDSRETCCW